LSYIALEEAFAIPALAARQSAPQIRIKSKADFFAYMNSRLADFDNLRLADMDEHGIDIQVLSLTVPGIQADADPAQARDNAVFANDFLADVVAKHPTRFKGFAALPTVDPDGSASELVRAVTQLGFRGALVNDHAQGRYLDDRAYDGLWSAAEELGVPIYIHPGSLPVDDWHVIAGRPEMYGASWSWGAETGGHALRLLYSGVFDRHPRATLILGHLGEFLPFQKSRLDSRYKVLDLEAPLQHLPSYYFGRNILLTTSGIHAPEEIQAAVLCAGEDAVMFAIDYPYERTADAIAAIERADLSPAVKEKVTHLNARRVLGI
jgi:2,3-dihydroxybenzoate decarboxylase